MLILFSSCSQQYELELGEGGSVTPFVVLNTPAHLNTGSSLVYSGQCFPEGNDVTVSIAGATPASVGPCACQGGAFTCSSVTYTLLPNDAQIVATGKDGGSNSIKALGVVDLINPGNLYENQAVSLVGSCSPDGVSSISVSLASGFVPSSMPNCDCVAGSFTCDPISFSTIPSTPTITVTETTGLPGVSSSDSETPVVLTPPLANFSVSNNENPYISLNASSSSVTTSGATIVNYKWTLYQGNSSSGTVLQTLNGAPTTSIAPSTYFDGGTLLEPAFNLSTNCQDYYVCLEVTDSNGGISSTPHCQMYNVAKADIPIQVEASGFALDLTPYIEMLPGADYPTWDWGDGSASSTGSFLSHTYAPGVYTASVNVCGGQVLTLDLDSYFYKEANVTQLPDLSSLSNLKKLDLDWNNVSHTFGGSEFEKNRNLEFLYMDHNSLSGVLPANLFANNVALKEISFYVNGLSGELPENLFANNQNLELIKLSANQFSGDLPENIFSNNPNLITLAFNVNQFSGALPANLFANNPNLLTLTFDTNQFSGDLPENVFDNNPALEYLNFSYNQFSGSLPANVFDNNPALEYLNFSENQFSGALPANVFDNNPALVELVFSANQFSGALPTGLFDYNVALQELVFRENQFSGSLPTGLLDNCPDLITLIFNDNQLNGSLPTGIFDNNPKLVYIYIYNNQLSGSLPTGLFDNNTDVVSIWMQSNRFTGSLPAGLFDNNVALEYLYLNGNQFSGTIPANLFDNNVALYLLNLGSNQFSGALPAGLFDNNINLGYLTISYNFFTLGASLANNSQLRSLVANNNFFITTDVDNFLLDLDAHGLSSGTVYLKQPSIVSPPSGAGITAKNNLISRGWYVLTD